MIGVIANPDDKPVIREFFELFKVPWEFYKDGQTYEAVLCGDYPNPETLDAKLVVLYSGRETVSDMEPKGPVQTRGKGAMLALAGRRLPIYGDFVTFPESFTFLRESASGKPVAWIRQTKDRVLVRVGYDLFREIQLLITTGQPEKNAAIPTLDRHIQLLRELITGSGIALLEIPPIPAGYPFIVCLTHDLDHARLSRHKLDPPMFGFLFRATLGSVLRVARGRLPLRGLLSNWLAAAKLPLIYLGLAKDIWYSFDRYLDLENGKPSTFFVVPFEKRPGHPSKRAAPRSRATRYDVSHIAEKLPRLRAAGCEIGLHGIDAWFQASLGRAEAERISEFSETRTLGVRMHWLFNNEKSPSVIEEAGFSYDSTVGYNETVGYHAGTSQVFKQLSVNHLLELPMHVMDTALFYPAYLDLTEEDAFKEILPLFDNATHEGGVVTINWHDRSIAPERQWGNFYVRVLRELDARGTWFCTASQAVSWFRKRRSITFDKSTCETDEISVKLAGASESSSPGFRLRRHQPAMLSDLFQPAAFGRKRYEETFFTGSVNIPLYDLTDVSKRNSKMNSAR
jgi:hypothetical protein